MEHVLVFPAEVIKPYATQPIFKASKKILKCIFSSDMFFMEREKAENDPDWLQVIPYCVLTNKAGIFSYKRTKKGGESRLHDKYSVGIGGHLNPIDKTEDESWFDVYKKGLIRELKEEVGLDVNKYDLLPKAVIYKPDTSVGAVHCGLVSKFVVDNNFQPTTTDYALSHGMFESCETIVKNKEMFEDWSQLVIDYLFKVEQL